jgi:hypothetical protein
MAPPNHEISKNDILHCFFKSIYHQEPTTMQQNQAIKQSSTILATLLLVTACGGGGSDSGSSPATPSAPAPASSSTYGTPAPSATTPTAITSTNQTALAKEVLSGLSGRQDSIDRATTVLGAEQINATPNLNRAIDFTLKQVTQIANSQVATGALATETIACGKSGNITNVFNADTKSYTITANNCIETDGSTTNGSMSFVFSGSIPKGARLESTTPYSASFSVNYQNIVLTDSGFINGAPANIEEKLNGSSSFSITSTGAYTRNVSLSIPLLAASATVTTGGTSKTATQVIENQSFVNGTSRTGTYSYNEAASISGKVSSGINNQSISLATNQPFVTRSVDVYPSSGQITVTGNQNSKIRLTALSNSQARLELDANGDGTYEGSQTISWASL